MATVRPSSRRAQRRSSPPPDGLLEHLLSHLLAPIDALGAAIYSIMIVLTFTLAFSVVKRTASPAQPIPDNFGTELFFSVLGVTVAWGLIEGLMLVLLAMLARGQKHRFLQEIQAADSDEEAVAVIADELDFVLEPVTSEEKRHRLYEDVLGHLRDSEPRAVGFQRSDAIEALGMVLVYLIAALPSLTPLWLLRNEPLAALRVSNIVSFVMLFFLGYRWGYYTGASRWKTGMLLVLFGVMLMAIAIPLGG